eukprot:5504964-Amphidinium_carterae.1
MHVGVPFISDPRYAAGVGQPDTVFASLQLLSSLPSFNIILVAHIFHVYSAVQKTEGHGKLPQCSILAFSLMACATQQLL